jgi:hypothetical protein
VCQRDSAFLQSVTKPKRLFIGIVDGLFTNSEGYSMSESKSLRQGYCRAQNEAADLVLKDIVMPMRIVLAAVTGLLVGGVSSAAVVAIKGPVFHWEMAGMYMVIFSALVGAIAGGLSAAVGSRPGTVAALRGLVGLCGGAVLGFAVGLAVVALSSARDPGAPSALAFWAVTVVVIAGALAGLIGSLMATTSNTR